MQQPKHFTLSDLPIDCLALVIVYAPTVHTIRSLLLTCRPLYALLTNASLTATTIFAPSSPVRLSCTMTIGPGSSFSELRQIPSCDSSPIPWITRLELILKLWDPMSTPPIQQDEETPKIASLESSFRSLLTPIRFPRLSDLSIHLEGYVVPRSTEPRKLNAEAVLNWTRECFFGCTTLRSLVLSGILTQIGPKWGNLGVFRQVFPELNDLRIGCCQYVGGGALQAATATAAAAPERQRALAFDDYVNAETVSDFREIGLALGLVGTQDRDIGIRLESEVSAGPLGGNLRIDELVVVEVGSHSVYGDELTPAEYETVFRKLMAILAEADLVEKMDLRFWTPRPLICTEMSSLRELKLELRDCMHLAISSLAFLPSLEVFTFRIQEYFSSAGPESDPPLALSLPKLRRVKVELKSIDRRNTWRVDDLFDPIQRLIAAASNLESLKISYATAYTSLLLSDGVGTTLLRYLPPRLTELHLPHPLLSRESYDRILSTYRRLRDVEFTDSQEFSPQAFFDLLQQNRGIYSLKVPGSNLSGSLIAHKSRLSDLCYAALRVLVLPNSDCFERIMNAFPSLVEVEIGAFSVPLQEESLLRETYVALHSFKITKNLSLSPPKLALLIRKFCRLRTLEVSEMITSFRIPDFVTGIRDLAALSRLRRVLLKGVEGEDSDIVALSRMLDEACVVRIEFVVENVVCGMDWGFDEEDEEEESSSCSSDEEDVDVVVL